MGCNRVLSGQPVRSARSHRVMTFSIFSSIQPNLAQAEPDFKTKFAIYYKTKNNKLMSSDVSGDTAEN